MISRIVCTPPLHVSLPPLREFPGTSPRVAHAVCTRGPWTFGDVANMHRTRSNSSSYGNAYTGVIITRLAVVGQLEMHLGTAAAASL